MSYSFYFFLFSLFSSSYANYLALIGSVTGDATDSIWIYDFNVKTGEFSKFINKTQTSSPSWFAQYPKDNPQYLVSGNEYIDKISLWEFNFNGDLIFRNQVSAGGGGPCFVSWDDTGRWIIVANYNDGSVSVVPVLEQDSGLLLGDPKFVIVNSGGNSHMALLDSTNRHVFIPDLGNDKVHQYLLNSDGTLSNNSIPFVTTGSESGPRHLAFHPTYLFAYLITEYSNVIQVFRYDENTGQLIGPIQIISTLPSSFNGTSNGAEVVVTPNGRFLYASNRGYDSIVTFKIDEESEANHLTVLTWTTQGVVWPRGFTIEPNGNFLVVASQNSNTTLSFRIEANGNLTSTGFEVDVPYPECVQIFSFPN